jgi:hypothetical protein
VLALAFIAALGFSPGGSTQAQGLPATSAPSTDLESVPENEIHPEQGPWFLNGAPPIAVPARNTGGQEASLETGLFDTITESVLGDAYAEGKWRPLGLSTFFSEGWLEPWVNAPAGRSGLTPRHGWLGSFEGVFYRLWLVSLTYQNDLARTHGGNGYSGDFTIFLPVGGRFELSLGVPFVTANGTGDPRRGYQSELGDMAVGARILLSETAAVSQTFNLGIVVPTGQMATGGGLMALFPRYSFWSNPAGAWVVRGGTGISVPLNNHD